MAAINSARAISNSWAAVGRPSSNVGDRRSGNRFGNTISDASVFLRALLSRNSFCGNPDGILVTGNSGLYKFDDQLATHKFLQSGLRPILYFYDGFKRLSPDYAFFFP
jgi:hypothetical protein